MNECYACNWESHLYLDVVLDTLAYKVGNVPPCLSWEVVTENCFTCVRNSTSAFQGRAYKISLGSISMGYAWTCTHEIVLHCGLWVGVSLSTHVYLICMWNFYLCIWIYISMYEFGGSIPKPSSAHDFICPCFAMVVKIFSPIVGWESNIPLGRHPTRPALSAMKWQYLGNNVWSLKCCAVLCYQRFVPWPSKEAAVFNWAFILFLRLSLWPSGRCIFWERRNCMHRNFQESIIA